MTGDERMEDRLASKAQAWAWALRGCGAVWVFLAWWIASGGGLAASAGAVVVLGSTFVALEMRAETAGEVAIAALEARLCRLEEEWRDAPH